MSKSYSLCHGSARPSFGSPSYPSPLDRIRSGHQKPPHPLALHESFEVNQSFPKASRLSHLQKDALPDTPDLKKKLADFKGESPVDVM